MLIWGAPGGPEQAKAKDVAMVEDAGERFPRPRLLFWLEVAAVAIYGAAAIIAVVENGYGLWPPPGIPVFVPVYAGMGWFLVFLSPFILGALIFLYDAFSVIDLLLNMKRVRVADWWAPAVLVLAVGAFSLG